VQPEVRVVQRLRSRESVLFMVVRSPAVESPREVEAPLEKKEQGTAGDRT